MKQLTLSAILLISFVSLVGCGKPATTSGEMTYRTPFPLNPPTYVCYKTPGVITIDGRLSPGEWDAIPWTSDFVDIEGDKRPAPHFRTRAKMAHDSLGMYFVALLEEPHVWATITQHDTVIFQNNDFELFIDPTGETHYYMEYEINALGTDWDLLLTKPYRDGGRALNNWEFAGIRSAIHIDGTLNNPADTDRSWSVEVFIPWKSIYQVAGHKRLPLESDQFRVNFSRVEWTTKVTNGSYSKIPIQGEDKIREYNWVWAPTGIVDIHRPEYWGYVQFTDKVAGTAEVAFITNPDETAKWALRNLYYRQREYAAANGSFAEDITHLKPEEICPSEYIGKFTLHTTPSLYEITLPVDGKTWHIRQDGLVWSSQ